ncbi:hypothetical protein ASPSYDRAFT_865299 [Aspergillus sydowii CBS 593.65]|uniref:Uncharacterized protein n=1 Tax=Aspergillus sydowii CBS 593.65 TaxID=1036612 RepID=A0A1L9TJ37_9EURO|nr:uncharacterized protein ASPSYDRAFT_865299 [Aspergillus sydowii CBS 593.65]OJJ59436.1 hypothetical protein ASPSYDRAFT_865299 [Aspergillus sydowii CBS 593.65]
MSFVRFLSQLPVAETRSSCQRESLLAERPRDRLRRWNGVSSRRDMVPLLSSNQGHGEIRHKSRSIPHQDERRVRWPKGEKSKRSRNISAADWPSTHWCAGRKITTVTHPKGLCVGSHRGRFSRRTVVRVTSPSIYVSGTSINPVAIPLVVADCQRPLRAPSERAV